jgi:predicted dehydrogenase
MNRREWITGAVWSAASLNRVHGANERIGIALIGSGRRGREVMKAFLETNEAELRSVCDIYDVQRERARAALGAVPHECSRHEEALSRPGVDAVLIAVPDHLHLDIAKDALASGKHVYLEKPCTHRFEEGAALEKAAEAAGRVCQVGTQQRSGTHYRRAKEDIFGEKRLGHVPFVRASWSNFPWQARRIGLKPKPAGLDWPRFLGRAPKVQYDWVRYDSWRYFPDYGGGVLADILNHWADVAQWMMGDANPRAAVALGGIYELNDGRLNPDTVNAVVQYRDWNLAFESTVLPVRDDRPSVVFQGTEGTLDLARDGYVFTPHKGAAVRVAAEGSLEAAHARDFSAAVRTGRAPSAGIRAALEGVLPSHLTRAAYWSGNRVRYDAAKNEIITG